MKHVFKKHRKFLGHSQNFQDTVWIVGALGQATSIRENLAKSPKYRIVQGVWIFSRILEKFDKNLIKYFLTHSQNFMDSSSCLVFFHGYCVDTWTTWTGYQLSVIRTFPIIFKYTYRTVSEKKINMKFENIQFYRRFFK